MADTVVTVILRARDEASSALKKVDGEMQAVALSAGAITAVAGAAAAALTGIATTAGQEADDLRVLGVQSGQSTEDISRLKFAADQLDTSLPAVATSIRFMNRSLLEARQPGSEAQKTLKEIGISGEQLARGLGPPSQAFLTIIDHLNSIEDPGVKAALAMKIFGRGASEIIPLINAGSGAIAEMEARSDELGATISNTAGVLGDEYGDAVKEATAATAGLKSQIAVALLPELTKVVQSYTNAAAAANRWAAQNPAVARATFDTATQLTGLGLAITSFLAVVPLLRAGLAAIGIEMTALAAAGGPITIAITAFTALLFIVNKVRAEAEKPFQVKVATDAKGAQAELERLIALRGEALRKQREAEARIEAAPKPRDNSVEVEGLPKGARIGTDAGGIVPPASKALVEAEHDAQAAAAQVAEFDKSIAKAGEQLRQFDKGSVGVFDNTVAGAKAGKSALDDFLEALEKAKHPDIDLNAALKPEKTELRRTVDLHTTTPAIDTTALEEVPKQLFLSSQVAQDLLGTLSAMGIPTKELANDLEAIGSGLTETQALGIGLVATLQAAGAEAFNPLLVGAQGMQEAIGNLRQGFDSAFNSLGKHILDGTLGMLKFANVLRDAFKAAAQFAVELGIAIVKALILKAIGFGIGLAGGGPVQGPVIPGKARGGPVELMETSPLHFERGGPVGSAAPPRLFRLPGYAAGGPVKALAAGLAAGGLFTAPIHAAYGYSIPGGPSFADTVPAMLARGEFVVANDGARTGTSMMTGLISGLAALKDVLGSGGQPAPPPFRAGPVVGELHLHATDADSVRNMVRPGGSFGRQLERAAELRR